MKMSQADAQIFNNMQCYENPQIKGTQLLLECFGYITVKQNTLSRKN